MSVRKRAFTVSIFFAVLLFSASAMSFVHKEETHHFDSEIMLASLYGDSTGSVSEESFWNDVAISLVTVSKDDPVYSWFGHSGLLLEFPGRRAVLYDWGRFSFDDGFYGNFIMGRLWYECGSSDALSEFAYLERCGRTVSKVKLNFPAKTKQDIARYLLQNDSEQYKTYLYHHYRDNCATRIRDIINKATGGEFEKWAKSQKGRSFREQTSRMLANNILWQWLLDFLQGPQIDGSATRWDEMFLPSELEKGVIEFSSLAENREYVCDFRNTDTRPADFETPQDRSLIWLCIGLAVSLLCIAGKMKSKTLYRAVSLSFQIITGIAGTLLFFMMNFTSHDVCYFNANILFFHPFLLITAFLCMNEKKHRKLLVKFYKVQCFTALAYLLLSLFLPDIFRQDNTAQLCTIVPFFCTQLLLLNRTDTLKSNFQNSIHKS